MTEKAQLGIESQSASLGSPSPARLLQRQCACGQLAPGGECDECKKKDLRLQRKSNDSSTPEVAPPIVHDVLRSPGRPLDRETRNSMEPRFGQDFSTVRVHSDARAAESARAVNALAYTVGSDVVFADGEFRPSEPQGQTLLAHELTHVVQQGGAAGYSEPLVVGSPHTTAEAEAHRAAAAVGAGGSSTIHARASSGTMQRTVAGDIGGGVVGAAAGAALGSLGGIGGAIAGGVLGGLAGAVIGDLLTANTRSLTGPEANAAKSVFGSSLNLSPIKLAEAPLMAAGGYARTPFNTVYFPPGTFQLPFSQLMPWLIHELTHVWQHQHGVSVLTKVWWALHGASAYPYGGEAALRRDAKAGKHFRDYNTEQQADIMKDFYVAQTSGADTSAFDPFVAEVRGPVLNDRNLKTSGSATSAVA